jgi:hypothetical protein
MKRINFETLEQLALTHPTQWHQLIAAGTWEPSHFFLNIEAAVEARILQGEILPASLPINQLRSPVEIENIAAICDTCSWNINWVCEHPGCQPCKQRREGGIKPRLIDLNFHCPATKWR